jgi:hypothetical protein
MSFVISSADRGCQVPVRTLYGFTTLLLEDVYRLEDEEEVVGRT